MAAVVYNDRPREGEQGHLVVLLSDVAQPPAGASPDPIRYPKAWAKVDISVTVRADLSMDAVAELPDPVENITRGDSRCDNYPDGICVEGAYAQIADMILSLNGSTGADRGHPLLKNPTFCDPQSVKAEFRGYAYNSLLFQDAFLVGAIWSRAHGDGKTVRDSAPYQVTGCERIPYNPKLSLRFDNTGPAAVPAISATFTQGPDEATTGSARVKFPSSFKINADNTREHCSEENLKATEEDPAHKDHCPEASKIGTVTAESPLIPIGQKLEGNVYLAGLTGDSVKFAAFLRGFVDLRIDAEGKVEDDLSITATLKDLPAAPVSRFDLLLDGGKDKGLLKLPRVCGPEMITANFTSHSKKIKRNTVPLEVKGCKDPTLDVELSNRRKGKPTDLDLTVSSRGTAIKSVEFRLARRLHWGQRKRLSSRVASGSGAAKRTKKIRRLRSAGLITFQTASGERKVRLKAKKTKWGNLGLVPLRRKTREGKIAAAQVPGFKASLFRTARRQPALIRKKKAKGDHGRKGKGSRGRTKRRRVRRQSELTLTGLPGEDLTAVELSLKGKDRRRKFFLKNPIGCERPLNFVAIVTTKDGRKLALKDRVYLRGAGCKKRKRHKGVRQR